MGWDMIYASQTMAKPSGRQYHYEQKKKRMISLIKNITNRNTNRKNYTRTPRSLEQNFVYSSEIGRFILRLKINLWTN